MLEEGEFFVLPAASSTAAEVQIKLGMVGVRGVRSCTSELQAWRTRWIECSKHPPAAPVQ